MTTTEFVRLEPYDLAQMATRLQVMLTPEGAQAWYAHDVGELLKEVTLLRQEIDAAKDSLGRSVLSEPSDDLIELSEQWKASVSGLWEKAQFKKLRSDNAALSVEVAQLEQNLELAIQAHLAHEQVSAEETNALIDKIQNLEDALADAAADAERFKDAARLALEERIAAETATAAAERSSTEQALAYALQIEDLKASYRTALQALIEQTLS